jgi:hypothetical protein
MGKKKAVGRPTLYGDKVLLEAKAYLSNHVALGDLVPNILGLADHLEIGARTIYDWEKQEDKKEFSRILERIKAKQGKLLINGGLSGEMNSNITKMMLHHHGFSDKQEVDVTSKGDKIELVERVIKSLPK